VIFNQTADPEKVRRFSRHESDFSPNTFEGFYIGHRLSGDPAVDALYTLSD
jgi:hypothetical protein